MWSSRDIALVIVFAAIALAYSATVIQIPRMITGIVGLGYYLGSGIIIILNVAFLLFGGSRWKFFSVVAIERMLLFVIFVSMGPILFFQSVPLLIGKFIQDVVFNSFYGYFERRKKLLWLSIIFAVLGIILDIFLRILLYPLLMTPEYTTAYIGMVSLMFPVILFNAFVGGYFGYLIYKRVRRSFYRKND